MTLLLKEEITFPRWDGDPEFDPYGTYKEVVLALKYGRSLVLQSYSHGKFKNYAIEWYLGNRASAGLARFASRGGAAADPFGGPPAADTEVIQRRGAAPAPVPAAAPMDRKGR